ncbi:MAG: hypothetical protein F6K30_29125 [Cyanothece sp. SIO2G6]|nr:hypothetical protein [Cyanothece sp. SIO2G6]
MNINQLESQVKYLTNSDGQTTEVVIPIDLWESLLGLLGQSASGLSSIDEDEPKAEILEDLKRSLKDGATGQTYPITELWAELEV